MRSVCKSVNTIIRLRCTLATHMRLNMSGHPRSPTWMRLHMIECLRDIILGNKLATTVRVIAVSLRSSWNTSVLEQEGHLVMTIQRVLPTSIQYTRLVKGEILPLTTYPIIVTLVDIIPATHLCIVVTITMTLQTKPQH
uniref:Uncharacterized protein n=1 Tax=Cacopsylla melanoneura TaxID=428564 RepID=A0A8D8RRE6_9HEMI